MKTKTLLLFVVVGLFVWNVALSVHNVQQSHKINELIEISAELNGIDKDTVKLIKDFYEEQGEFNARDWAALDRIIPWLEEHHPEFRNYRK